MSGSSFSPRVTRRGIQFALGSLWLLDGLLQLQPHMFTADFADVVIFQAAQGQPAFIGGPMHFFIGLFVWQPALANAGIALVQLGLGVLILWKPTAKLGLGASVGWGLFVWYIGEAFSGLASGHSVMLMGLPGAALIYVLLALGVMPSEARPDDMRAKRPAYWLVGAWACLWVLGAIYQVMPGQNTVADMTSMISANAQGAPAWLSRIDDQTAHILGKFGTATVDPGAMAGMPGMAMLAPQTDPATLGPHAQKVSGFWFLLILAIVQLVIAFAVIIPGFIRIFAVIIGSLLSVGFWIVGQSLGSYYTGLATDPNTGPLLVLLGIAVLGCTQHDMAVKAYFGRIKKGLRDEVRAFNEA
jgi:hypothetical protein